MYPCVHKKRGVIPFILIGCLLVSHLCNSSEIKSPLAALDLSPSEREWLKKNKAIRIGGPQNFPPFHYYDEKGGLKGLTADYINMIANQVGLRVKSSEKQPWPKVLEAIKSGEIDLIPCIARTKDTEDDTLERIMRRSDLALYRAKKEGRNRVAVERL